MMNSKTPTCHRSGLEFDTVHTAVALAFATLFMVFVWLFFFITGP